MRDAGLEKQVFPVHAEAHTLPFAHDFFDAIVSMDSYHYYGTDDLYIGHFVRFLKPDGQIGIVVPGLVQELRSAEPPEHLQPYWYWDFCSFHSPGWWHRHWEKSGFVSVELADMIPDGWKHWQRSDEISAEWLDRSADEAKMVRADGGKNLGFTRMVARRIQKPKWAA